MLGVLFYDTTHEKYDVHLDTGGNYGGLSGGDEIDVLIAGKWRQAVLERITIDELTSNGLVRYEPNGCEFWYLTDPASEKLIPLDQMTGLTVDIGGE